MPSIQAVIRCVLYLYQAHHVLQTADQFRHSGNRYRISMDPAWTRSNCDLEQWVPPRLLSDTMDSGVALTVLGCTLKT